MIKEPLLNSLDNPLISILVYNYEGQYLRQCLESIFLQDILTNLEIILIDDATNDVSWETALEYSVKYPKIMTVSRNRRPLGAIYNRHHCRRMAKGNYCALLTSDQAFLPAYVKECVDRLRADPQARFDTVRHKEKLHVEPPSMKQSPLVSILCYNYNYGQYLRQCLESVFAQTYENIELCFSDNASTDESWEIALEFARKYPGKMRLTHNRVNFGPDYNFNNCYTMKLGKYYITFCSDDVLMPDYVEKCVNALEANPNAGMALVNRAIIDENGNRTDEAPFYDQSCIIPGEEQAAVYIMAGINPSVSQIMYRSDLVVGRSAMGFTLGARYYGARIQDFLMAADFDVAYLKDALLLHRIHSQSDTSQVDANLMPIIGLYVLNHQFADVAMVRNMTKVVDRLPASIEKLAGLAVRYSVKFLLSGQEVTAKRYFYLAVAMNSEISTNITWQKIQMFWSATEENKTEIIKELMESDNLATRTISYQPPPGSKPI
jgi:glycosyltransferase involved in cell wall biosynthesis